MSTGRPWTLLGGAVCAVALGAPVSADAASSVPRIISPSQNGLVRGASVTVKVRVASGAGSFRALIDGRDITSLFSTNGNLRIARVPAGRALRAGTNHVFVKTGQGNKESADENTFVLGRPSDPLLQTVGPTRVRVQGAAGVVARTLPGSIFRARLNGKPVHQLFRTRGAGTRSAILGASDGLKFGRNRLVQLAWTPDGRYDREVSEIIVPRDRPLVGARAPLRTRIGATTTFSGLSSQPSHRGARLAYSWKIVLAPKGSKARLNGAQTSKPRLRPDRRGTYRAELTVRERRRGARSLGKPSSEIVTVGARDGGGAVGVPVETCAKPDCSIVIGNDAPITPDPAKSITLVVLSRDTAELKSDPTHYENSIAGVGQLHDAISKLDGQSLVIVSGTNGTAPGAPINDALAPIGAKSLFLAPIYGGASFSVIGVPTWADGNAHTNLGAQLGAPGIEATPQGDIYGYLQVNPLIKKYTFVRRDYVGFDTQVNETARSNTITVTGTSGSPTQSYSAEFPGTGAGFHVLVLNDKTLEPRENGNRAFLTTSSGSSQSIGKDREAQDAMASMLHQFRRDGRTRDSVFFIQTIGHPQPTTSAWQGINDELVALGGTPTATNGLDGTRGYALVAHPGQPASESIGVAPRPPPAPPNSQLGALQGMMNRNQASQFQPLLSDPTGDNFDMQLVNVAYQPATPWPERDTPGKRTAITYLLKQLTPPLPGTDAIDSYTNANNDSHWDGYAADVTKVSYPDIGHGFSKADLRAVQRELHDEFSYVAQVAGFMSRMKQTITEAGLATQGQMAQMTNEIIDANRITRDKSSNPGPALEIFGLAMEFLGDAFPEGKIAESVLKANTLTATGLIIAGIAVESYGQHGESEGQPILGELSTKAGDLAADLSNAYLKHLTALDFIRDVLVTDYGKLKTAATRAASDPDWQIPMQARVALTASAKRWFFERLFPITFNTWNLGGASKDGWSCYYFGRTFTTFGATPASGQLRAPSRISDDGHGGIRRDYDNLVIGRTETFNGTDDNTQHSFPPPEKFTDQLFAEPNVEVTPPTGLGADKTNFMLQTLPSRGVPPSGQRCPGV